MSKNTTKQENPTAGDEDVFDIVAALAVDGGDPLPAKLGPHEFRIRRAFTGAEVLAVSEAATKGKGEIIAATLTEDVDPVELSEYIESHMTDVAGRLWGVLFTKAGLALRGE